MGQGASALLCQDRSAFRGSRKKNGVLRVTRRRVIQSIYLRCKTAVKFLKQMRWAVLMGCSVVVLRTCSLLRLRLPMNSFFRPYNLVRFRPSSVPSRVVSFLRELPPRDRIN
jgi:hypothetical protein